MFGSLPPYMPLLHVLCYADFDPVNILNSIYRNHKKYGLVRLLIMFFLEDIFLGRLFN